MVENTAKTCRVGVQNCRIVLKSIKVVGGKCTPRALILQESDNNLMGSPDTRWYSTCIADDVKAIKGILHNISLQTRPQKEYS